MAYMHLMNHPLPPLLLLSFESSVVFVCLHHSGTLALVIQHDPLFAMFSTDMSYRQSSNKDATICDACQQGKSHQLSFSVSTHIVKTPLELVFFRCMGSWPDIRYLLVVMNITSVLLMLIVGLLGFIFLSASLMCSMCF
jgi:hypothetical protein